MNITYILNAAFVSIVFFIYKYIQTHNNPDQFEQKTIIKESIFLFIASSMGNFLIGEYFYNDFYLKIFPLQNAKPATEVFTDKPGF